MALTLIAFAVALGVLITFHELGHYLVARWCGVRVLRFSLGFGKVLLRRTDRQGTEWAFSAIPLGGYVKMLDTPEPGAPASQQREAFNLQPVSRRMAIVAAGPVFNLVLAVLLYAVLNLVGTQEPAAILAAPTAQSPAAQAGLVAGDRITAINQREVQSWSQVRWELMGLLSDGGAVELTVDHAGVTTPRYLDLPPASDPSKDDPMRRVGLMLQGPPPTIKSIVPGSAAERAGLRAGDRIVDVGTERDPSVGQVISTIQKHAGDSLLLRVERAGTRVDVPVVPDTHKLESGESVGRIGVQLGGDIPMVLVSYGVYDSLARAVTRTADTAWFSLRMMGKMLVGEVSWRNVSGPVTIADYAGQTARIGWAAYVAFLALVSISLGVLNLLPIPMLDGGHLLYYLIEIVRGSPPPARWVEISQRAGVGLLACLMVLALFNDLTRIFS